MDPGGAVPGLTRHHRVRPPVADRSARAARACDGTYRGGRLSGLDALQHVSWGRWVTLLGQVTPVFFVVGG
ncbi:MAG: hypothetical protein QOF44_6005 [Streptomyces sp.]|nr:hypothetical protein [Streptomyces sp.]